MPYLRLVGFTSDVVLSAINPYIYPGYLFNNPVDRFYQISPFRYLYGININDSCDLILNDTIPEKIKKQIKEKIKEKLDDTGNININFIGCIYRRPEIIQKLTDATIPLKIELFNEKVDTIINEDELNKLKSKLESKGAIYATTIAKINEKLLPKTGGSSKNNNIYMIKLFTNNISENNFIAYKNIPYQGDIPLSFIEKLFDNSFDLIPTKIIYKKN